MSNQYNTQKPFSVYCAWCKVHVSGPKTDDQSQISHTICPACKSALDRQIETLRKAGR